ncbi:MULTISPECIES: MFS transporter [unclassified Crossiella]|uniref:MFS transporter n=1 Tax=unclassified Crossiella TaxID=2620835 RepID=UPI001FFE9387|nr:MULTISPECIES: MFS transporter [unclassified Crossiella]MCK2244611.1 MFS transporter [Crossiella sp. S99.2]MCK2258242.1 MFS transporter [Crossiella sp. S99.1]
MTSPTYRWRWPALAALLLAEAMNLFDSTVLPVTGPAIRADLAVGESTLQWLTTGYTLPFALLLITGGRLGDILGRRRVFVAGVLVFALASAVCAGAPSAAVLLTGRVVQGASAALIIPQTFGLIRAMFTGAEVAKALGTIGPVMALSALCGPVAGGLLTDANLFGLGWRPVFLINLPLGLAVLAIAPLIREDRSPARPRLDISGTLLAALGLGLLVFPLVEGNNSAWTWPCLALGLTTLIVFGWHQRGRTNPLVEPGLFRGKVFPASLAGSLLFFAVLNGLLFVLALHLQLTQGQTPSSAAFTLLPWSAGLAIGSWTAGALLVPRFGPKVMRLGLGLVLVGLAGLAISLTAVPLLITGIGLGVFTVPFFGNALAGVTAHETGSAAGLLNAVQQLGATIGVALLGTVFFGAGAHLVVLIAIGLIAAVLALTRAMLPAARTNLAAGR